MYTCKLYVDIISSVSELRDSLYTTVHDTSELWTARQAQVADKEAPWKIKKGRAEGGGESDSSVPQFMRPFHELVPCYFFHYRNNFYHWSVRQGHDVWRLLLPFTHTHTRANENFFPHHKGSGDGGGASDGRGGESPSTDGATEFASSKVVRYKVGCSY